MYIASQLLITTLTTSPAPMIDPVRDLCDLVHVDTGVPVHCAAHNEGAPIYDANVCCTDGRCVAADGTACREPELLYYCGLGEVLDGFVQCYFEVPDYCDVFLCTSSLAPPPLELGICCNEGVCWAHTKPHDCELGDLLWCNSGVSNSDGTITCLDDEEG